MKRRSRCATAGVERVAGLDEGVEAVGVEHLGPQVDVVAGRVAVAGEQVLEVRQPVVACRSPAGSADARSSSARSNSTTSSRPRASVSACAAMSTSADAA